MVDEKIKTAKSDSSVCPECGSSMSYDPETRSLKCDYCGKKISLDWERTTEELDFDDVIDVSKTWQNEKRIIRCKGCGAENLVSRQELSVTCPFCGSNEVVNIDEVPGLKPNRIIPFKVKKEDSLISFRNKLKKAFYCPRILKKSDFSPEINGVYVPSWTYDTKTYSTYEAHLGEHYTVVVGSGKDRHKETRTRWYYVRGTYSKFYDDILVDSGKSINQKEMNLLTPFDTNNSIVYDETYLAGFSAEHYTLDVKQGFERAKSYIDKDLKSSILSEYKYDELDYIKIHTKYLDKTYKYVVLPIWIGLYKYKKKSYRFLVNGETGKAYAKYPKSFLKILITILVIFAVVGFFLLLGYLSE